MTTDNSDHTDGDIRVYPFNPCSIFSFDRLWREILQNLFILARESRICFRFSVYFRLFRCKRSTLPFYSLGCPVLEEPQDLLFVVALAFLQETRVLDVYHLPFLIQHHKHGETETGRVVQSCSSPPFCNKGEYLLIKHNGEYQGDFFYSLCIICQIFFISLQLQ